MKQRAFLAGLFGGAFIAVTSAIARAAGVRMDLEWELGSFFTGAHDALAVHTFVIGLVLQIAIGGLFGMLYSAILSRTERAGVLPGAMLGLVHALLAGAALAAMPPFHPAIPELIPKPGMLLIERGVAASVIFVLQHVGFGMWMSALATRRRAIEGDRIRG
jgi:uncharacterized membrane protein YeaQ/YmgE (transglycosylase-associated protein family)